MNSLQRFVRPFAGSLLALALTCLGGFAAPLPVHAGTVDLSPAPPNLSKTVDPNIVVTFDDSGSMAWTAMGDHRPFDDGSWDGKWACANTLDPAAAASSPLALTMNGVYYNPNIKYLPPLYEDGSSFPNADNTLKAVWNDGIDANKPRNPDTSPSTTSFLGARTTTTKNYTDDADTTTKYTQKTCASVENNQNAYFVPNSCKPSIYSGYQQYDEYQPNSNYRTHSAQCGNNADVGSCACTTLTKGTGNSTDSYNTQCAWTETTVSDARWTCSVQGASHSFNDDNSPLLDNESGPYYYTYTGPTIVTDTYGTPDATSITSIYTSGNWTAVQVPASQYQNWANWWAYYRSRNQMTRTALSRVFGALGGNIRVAWQNINSGTYDLPDDAIIANLVNAGTTCKASSISPGTEQTDTNAQCYRDAFFNWIYDTGASGGTPDRGATKRAGKFYSRDLTKNALDPYWNGKANTGTDTTIAADLSCRQNYQMLVTDGYWNGNDNITTPDSSTLATSLTLPDGSKYDGATSKQTAIFKAATDANSEANMADIAFYYWAHDLEPGTAASSGATPTGGLANGNAPYMHDLTTGITGTTPLLAGDDPFENEEIYWNPKNDPATWQHMVNYMVTLGINGYLHFSTDTDCTDSSSDACLLRKGDTNSTGAVGWPETTRGGGSIGSPGVIDDDWHAALVSRGSYFSASNPSVLVSHLSQIIHNISARAGSAVAGTVNSGVWTTQSVAYQGSYNSANWSGTVKAFEQTLVPAAPSSTNPNGNDVLQRGAEKWDADCLLTGGGCQSGSSTVASARDPDSRIIFTAAENATGTKYVGTTFEWANLSDSEKEALNASPSITRTSTAVVSDGHGQDRLDWLRGDRSKEGSELRSRSSVMGAVIRSQPLYVSYPDNGYRDEFPDNSVGDTAPENAKPYHTFVTDHIDRTPMLYVGANDGMLHALDAATGKEDFAYVPASVYWRSPPVPAASSSSPDAPGVPGLSKLTATSNFRFLPTVDNTPVERDVFFDGDWHTLLVGTLGMGGRGVYALDVTNPDDATNTTTSAGKKVLWEFNSQSTGGADLGYTYGQPVIARLATGKWAVLVPGGYFPNDITDPNHYAPAAASSVGSMFVLNAQTGALIRELKTSDAKTGATVKSYGMATPVLGDYDDDQVADVAFAGDLMGNLWRFDLTSSDPTKWQIDLVFQGATNTTTGAPLQPITAKPRLFPDPTTNQFMVVFGTGKYLGNGDRLKTGTPTQALYGIREEGESGTTNFLKKFPSGYYPIDKTKLVQQYLTTQDGLLYLTTKTLAGTSTGWKVQLDATPGERVVQRAGALFSSNQALFTTLIPAGDDPCNPDRSASQLLLSAVTGGGGGGIVEPPYTGNPPKPPKVPPECTTGSDCNPVHVGCTGSDCAAKMPGGSPISDSGAEQPVVVEPGGCRGITATGLNIPMACWRRRSWKVLFPQQ